MKTLTKDERASLRDVLGRQQDVIVLVSDLYVTFYTKGALGNRVVKIEREDGTREKELRKWMAFDIGERERMRGVRGQLG